MRWPWSDRGSDRTMARGRAGYRDAAGHAVVPSAVPPPQRPGAAVWLLDVDGVLNARDPGWTGGVAEGWARAGHGRFRIRWSPALVDRILTIDRGGGVEVRWATTWVPWIEQIEQLLGLPSWPLAFGGPHEGDGTPAMPTPWRKLEAAHGVIEDEARPLIWTDDDAIPVGGDDLERLTVGHPSALLIRPRSHHGLQPDHLDAIEAFVRTGGMAID